MYRDGVAPAPASGMIKESSLRGFDVEVRKTALSNINYTLQVMDSYGELHVQTRAGQCDVGWAQFFRTATREACETDNPDICKPVGANALAGLAPSWESYRCCTDFSLNIVEYNIRMMYLGNAGGSGDRFFYAISHTLLDAFSINFFCFLFLWILISAHLVWGAERHNNSVQFPKSYIDGIDDSIWWAAVTVTTVGYGDKTPKTPLGRVIGLTWMFIGIALCGILNGHMANRFTELREELTITGTEDMRGKRVCGYEMTFDSASGSAAFNARAQELCLPSPARTDLLYVSPAFVSWQWYMPDNIAYTKVPAANVAECGQKLREGLADIVVMDGPMLAYYISNDPWAQTVSLLLTESIATVPVGLVFSYNADPQLRREVNAKILELYDTNFFFDLENKWFPKIPAVVEDQLEWTLIGPTLGFFGAYLALQVVLWWSGRAGRMKATTVQPQSAVKSRTYEANSGHLGDELVDAVVELPPEMKD